MNGPLIKVGPEVVSLTPEQIKWGMVMYVDPRDYHVSEYNARTCDIERHIEHLENSILTVGFRKPLISDENKGIVDGSRRHLIALKHGLLMPVIHVNYGEDFRDPIVLRIIDSIVSNMDEPNLPRELGVLVNKATSTGMPLSKISDMLGVDWKLVNGWAQSVKIPADVIPPEQQTEEVKTKWADKAPRKQEVVTKITRAMEGTPKEKAATAMKLLDTNYDILDNTIRELNEGSDVDIETRTEPVTIKTSPDKLDWFPATRSLIRQMSKARAWDPLLFQMVCVWKVIFRKNEVTQDDYNEFKEYQKEIVRSANK